MVDGQDEKKAGPKKAEASKPAEKAEVVVPEVDLGPAVESLEAHVEALEGMVSHLEERFAAFLTGLSDNFGKEYVQQFLAEE